MRVREVQSPPKQRVPGIQRPDLSPAGETKDRSEIREVEAMTRDLAECGCRLHPHSGFRGVLPSFEATAQGGPKPTKHSVSLCFCRWPSTVLKSRASEPTCSGDARRRTFAGRPKCVGHIDRRLTRCVLTDALSAPIKKGADGGGRSKLISRSPARPDGLRWI